MPSVIERPLALMTSVPVLANSSVFARTLAVRVSEERQLFEHLFFHSSRT